MYVVRYVRQNVARVHNYVKRFELSDYDTTIVLQQSELSLRSLHGRSF